MLLAVAENASHGKRRTRADVQRAIEVLLIDPEWGMWSDGQIAEKVDTDPKTVGAARRRLTEDGRLQPADVRRGRDGRTYATARKPATKGKNGAAADTNKPVQVPTVVATTDPVSEIFGAHTDVVVNDAEPTLTAVTVREAEPKVTKPNLPETPMTAPTSDPSADTDGTNETMTLSPAGNAAQSSQPPGITSADDARAMIMGLAQEWSLDAWVAGAPNRVPTGGDASGLCRRL